MRLQLKLAIAGAALLLVLLFVILLNSGLGVDRDETITDLNRPEIVGDRGAGP